MIESASNGYWAPFAWFIIMLLVILMWWGPGMFSEKSLNDSTYARKITFYLASIGVLLIPALHIANRML